MKKKLLFIFLALSLIALPLLNACAAPAPAPAPAPTPAPTPAPAPAPKAITWKMQSTFPAGDWTHIEVGKWVERVGVASGGRLVIDYHAAGELVGPYDVFDAVHAGTLDAGYCFPTYWMGKFPAAPFFAAVPCGMGTLEYLAWVRLGGGLELWREMYAPFNLHVMPIMCIPQECLGWFHKPVLTLEDYKGLKFRTIGYWAEILEKLGASVVSLPGGEVYAALERGVIDGAEFSKPATDKRLGFHEICDYVMFPGIHQYAGLTELIINKDSWQKLPDDLKTIVEVTANEAAFNALMDGPWTDIAAVEFFTDYGTEILVLSPEIQAELKRLWEELADEKAAEDPFIARVWESQKKFRERWEAYEEFNTLRYE